MGLASQPSFYSISISFPPPVILSGACRRAKRVGTRSRKACPELAEETPTPLRLDAATSGISLLLTDSPRRRSAANIRKGSTGDPDAHATDTEFWKSAKVVMPTPKEIVTMRLDAGLLRWLRQQRGYQTRINAILRVYVLAQGSP